MSKEQARFEPQAITVLEEPARDGVEHLVIPEFRRRIPVFEIHNLGHHKQAAKILAVGDRIAIYGGVWGGIYAVPERGSDYGFFKKIKVGRPAEAKIPMLTLPEVANSLIDWDKVHPELRFLKRFWNFEKLWSTHGAFLHIVAPLKDNLETISEIFKTEPSDFTKRYPEAAPINATTGAFIFTANPYWKHFAWQFSRYSRLNCNIGVSTWNPHGEEPAYTFEEFKNHLRIGKIQAGDVDAVICDHHYEQLEAFSSHTIIALALAGERPVCWVLRIGSLSPERFEDATGIKVEPIEGVKDVRKNPGENLDEKLAKMHAEDISRWQDEKPQIFFRG